MVISTQFSRVGYTPCGSYEPVMGSVPGYSRCTLAHDAAHDAFTKVSYLGGGIAFLAYHGRHGVSLNAASVKTHAFRVGALALAPLASLAAIAVGVGTFINPVDAQYLHAKGASGYRDVACWNGRTNDRYLNDPPSVIRMKFAALLAAAPLYMSAITVANIGLLLHAAGKAAMQGQLGRAGHLGACAAVAPLGAAVLVSLAAIGLVMPLEMRCAYGSVERTTRAWPTAPCFQPLNVTRPMWQVFHNFVGFKEHGLGGLPLDAAGDARI